MTIHVLARIVEVLVPELRVDHLVFEVLDSRDLDIEGRLVVVVPCGEDDGVRGECKASASVQVMET